MLLRFAAVVTLLPLLSAVALADEVGVGGGKPVIGRQDCEALATYHTPPGVNYQPGVDVNGRPVAPADLPGTNSYQLPRRVQFDVVINPMTYAGGQGAGSAAAGQYANTMLPVAHVAIDLATGEATIDGKPMDSDQEAYLRRICREAGY